MSTQAHDTANSAVALVGLIHEAAIEQHLELAASLARLRQLVSQMAGFIDAMEDERILRNKAIDHPTCRPRDIK